ncbi:Inner membrane protein YhaI [compost metagenome]
MKWYLKVLKNYVGFSGRARRKEYWMFNLFNSLIMLILYIPLFASVASMIVNGEPSGSGSAFSFVFFLYALALFLPSLAVTVRRLHDIGKSGWWYLISLVPFAGPIILLVFLCTDSEAAANQYGPNPKLEA